MRWVIFLILFFPYFSSQAQVQWASKVISVSSEESSSGSYTAEQALGVPNAMSDGAVETFAWAPSKNSSSGEYIHVGFANPARIQQIAVAESMNPGAIDKIYLIDVKGKKKLIYENKKPKASLQPRRLFKHSFSKTDFEVAEIKVELNTKAIPGRNQIDAIAMSTSRDPIKLEVDVVEYHEDVQRAERLGESVNSEFAERLPMIAPDGKTLYFARKFHPKNIGEENNDDIWVSYLEADGNWSRAVNMGAPLNNKTHNFVISVSPNQNQLYVGNDYKSSSKDGVSITSLKGRSWSRPDKLDVEDHYNDSPFVGYHVSVDGSILVMAVERKECIGERDLFVSFKKGKNWTKPRNLGTTINTVGEESSVFIAADSKTIYFASNGHQGYGGLDMFMSKRLDNSWTKWTKPKNLGPKINSSSNDYNYTIPAAGDYAYFASDNANGMSDLYRIPLPQEVQPEPVILLSGRIIDAETKRPIAAQLAYQQLEESEQHEIDSREDGGFIMVLPYGDDVAIHAELDGYFAVSENMPLSEKPLEEEDFDGSTATTSVNSDVDNKELEDLQLRLKDLNNELDVLSRNKAKTEASQKKKKTSSKTKDRSFRSDPELDALKHKYENLTRKRDKRQGEKLDDDPELNALKNKLKKHKEDSEAPKDNGTYAPEDDDDLNALKNKLKKHNNKDSAPEDVPSKTTTDSGEEDPEVDLEAIDFESLELWLTEELNDHLTPEVKHEIQEAEIENVEDDLLAELSPKMRKLVSNKNWIKQLRKDLFREKEVALEKLPAKTVHNFPSREIKNLANDLEGKLEKEIRKDLKKELKSEVLEALKQEMEIRMKKEIEQAIQKELKEKLKAQKEAEKQRKDQPVASIENRRTKPESESRVVPEYKELEADIVMVPIKVGQIIPMNNIFFDANKSSLKSQSNLEMQRVLQFLKSNSNLVVEVGGHTNGWCGHEFASELSRDRAQAVAQFFIKNGIPENKVQFRGYGKTQPIASNETLAGRKQNQRVELKILEIE